MAIEIKGLESENVQIGLGVLVCLSLMALFIFGMIKINDSINQSNKADCENLGERLEIKTSYMDKSCYAISKKKLILISYSKIAKDGILIE